MSKQDKKSNGANLGFEEKLWSAADKMRGHMDPGEYKHVVLGLVFLNSKIRVLDNFINSNINVVLM